MKNTGKNRSSPPRQTPEAGSTEAGRAAACRAARPGLGAEGALGLAAVLVGVKAVIAALLGHQLVVGACLGNAPGVYHQNFVCRAHSGKAVRHHKAGAAFQHGVNGVLNQLFRLGVIPIVNENDTVSTYEIQFGDNDTLSAIVASLIGADLLVLLSDIDGLFTDDPHTNPDAELIETVEKLDEKYLNMAKNTTGSDVGTGGMATKLNAARIASYSGADMIIANAKDVGVLHKIFEDDFIGTVFLSNKDEDFYIPDFIEENMG